MKPLPEPPLPLWSVDPVEWLQWRDQCLDLSTAFDGARRFQFALRVAKALETKPRLILINHFERLDYIDTYGHRILHRKPMVITPGNDVQICVFNRPKWLKIVRWSLRGHLPLHKLRGVPSDYLWLVEKHPDVAKLFFQRIARGVRLEANPFPAVG